jgi:hypothetical protein
MTAAEYLANPQKGVLRLVGMNAGINTQKLSRFAALAGRAVGTEAPLPQRPWVSASRWFELLTANFFPLIFVHLLLQQRIY